MRIRKQVMAGCMMAALFLNSMSLMAETASAENLQEAVTEEAEPGQQEAVTEEAEPAQQEAVTEESGISGELQEGDEISGFTVTEVYHSDLIDSDVYTFTHPYSGAALVYVKNEDPEAAFSVAFRTPYVDETDTNHVFEHAILAGSEKYPANDIFFDMENKAYSTFVNASTGFTATRYPVSSMSQDQLLKMMDVYMSCMEAPSILEDERFFQREAIRYELDDPEGDITLNGTVYAEDYGFLTDSSDVSTMQVLDALYPGETASNMIGTAHLNYRDLTYENTIATYERCYHYDNCLLYLYGDLELPRFLEFLDTEYLSKEPVYGTDLSRWQDGKTEPGHVETEEPIPAYEGDTVQSNSVITYAVDLDGTDDVDLMKWDIFCSLLNMPGSPLYNTLITEGIQSPVSAALYTGFAKNFAAVTMEYADPEQKEELKAVIETSLTQVVENGINPALMEMVLKAQELSSKLMRNSANTGVSLMNAFVEQWAGSGDCNYLRVMEQALRELEADSEQEAFRHMAETLLEPARSALVTSVPTPGLAEEHDAEVAQYLADMKAAMSEEELQELAAQTAAFNEWNAAEMPNNDYQIAPEDLPDPVQSDPFAVLEKDGITVYQGTAAVSGVGSYQIFFDLSGMDREEMEYLMLCQNYLTQMATDQHSPEELFVLCGEYLSGLTISPEYPWEAAGEAHRPMMSVSWNALTENFETSLALVLEVLTSTNYHDAGMLTYLTAVQADSWDMARQDGSDIADTMAHAGAGLRSDTRMFEMDVNGQECYYMMAEMAQRLQTEEGYAEELAGVLDNAVRKAFTKDRIVFMAVTGEEEKEMVAEQAAAMLSALPEKPEDADASYELPVPARSTGIGIEDSVNHTSFVADFMKDEGFEGRYLPFVYALNDKYTVPVFRFRLGAYSAGSLHQSQQGTLLTYTYSDPNVEKTIEALRAMPDYMADMELSQEELNGYILKAYGNATFPKGVLNEVMQNMEGDLLGADTARLNAVTEDIREAALDQLPEAAEHVGLVLDDAYLCTAGNENQIREAAECFDEVISYRAED